MAVGKRIDKWQCHGQGQGDAVSRVRVLLCVAVALVALVTILTLLFGCGGGEIAPQVKGSVTQNPTPTAGEWDVVVLGRIDLCGVCQRGSPKVTYIKVLAGGAPDDRDEGTLAFAGIATSILPADAVPQYVSQQDEIVFLKRVKDSNLYTIVAVWKATPENLARFNRR